MATKASTLLRAARKASLASRAAAAAASRAAATMASRSARAAGVAAGVACAARHPKSYPSRSFRACVDYEFPTSADYEHLPDDSTTPTDKDLESDEAVWALYERWCKAFDKKRDHAEMVQRFKIFKYYAEHVHSHNTDVPADREEAAIFLHKRREAELLVSKGEGLSSDFDDCHLPAMLGPLADGGDPFLRKCDYELLKDLEKSEARRAAKDVTVE